MIIYQGEIQKGNFPPVCSIRIEKNHSSDPKTAQWITTGRSWPGFKGCSSQTNSSLSNSSGGNTYQERLSFESF